MTNGNPKIAEVSAMDVIRRWVDAANAADRVAIKSLYAPDAVVDDNGREFEGPDAIEGWSDQELIGVNAQITARRIDWAPTGATLDSEVRSDGFSGPAIVRFTIRDGLIQRVEI